MNIYFLYSYSTRLETSKHSSLSGLPHSHPVARAPAWFKFALFLSHANQLFVSNTSCSDASVTTAGVFEHTKGDYVYMLLVCWAQMLLIGYALDMMVARVVATCSLSHRSLACRA